MCLFFEGVAIDVQNTPNVMRARHWHLYHLHETIYISVIYLVFVLKVMQCFQLIDDIFIKSLQSVQRIIINDKHCFELYGYDIMLDENLKP
jgi:hypothetical protein